MAYLDQSNDPRRRAAAIAGVAAIHAAIGLAVVTGLTVVGVTPLPDEWDPFTITPDPKPTQPPPERQPTEKAPSSTVYVPLPPIVPALPKNDYPVTLDRPVDSLEGGTELSITPTPMPSSTPAPTVQPRLARPSNDRNGWISNDDYPAPLLRREIEGTVGYKLIVGSNGKVSACDVTRSSGNSQLDEATCRLITRRARFEPATDGSGAKVIGSFSGTVRWQIPD